MPAWVHDRAQHLLAKNPKMKKEVAFAIATQQGHRLGKNPKGYGTALGKRVAKAKFDKPKKEYVKSPNPGNLQTPKLDTREKEAMLRVVKIAAMRDELLLIHKEAFVKKLVGALTRNVSTADMGHAAGNVKRTAGRALGQGMDKRMAQGAVFGGAARDLTKRKLPPGFKPSGLEI